MKRKPKAVIENHARKPPPVSAVDAVFNAYPKPVKARLLALRRLILQTAKATKGVGTLEETLK